MSSVKYTPSSEKVVQVEEEFRYEQDNYSVWIYKDRVYVNAIRGGCYVDSGIPFSIFKNAIKSYEEHTGKRIY